jgi:hypothetical protein|tara:strand:- start:360 stop:641 length:282 start_codon:yes stop_codon:yes gene_type:complete
MAITKTVEVGQVEVVGQYKAVQVRTDTVIKEDGTEISRKFHRHVLHPGKIDESDNWIDEDISGEDSSVQGIANAVWTQSVKDAFKAHLIAHKS